MPMISLREYNQEIESLVEHANFNEAIFHCKEILKSYPKCISTYRNLGKALLESKRYQESSDIFNKVLTVYPDDFIAHVGLSIAYEDARDLNTAIWHMEQAFDSQPSNLAIQEELKRLLGRRDGVQPAKIRLSRGALVRMYAKGDLYQQAIAEIKSALSNDPKRIDFEVILSNMQYLLGDHVDAIETCTTIIKVIPYCFDANRILSEVLSKTDKDENAKVYLNRLIALDPYYAFLSSGQSDTNLVPADKVILEKANYSGDATDKNISSDWTKQIGIDLSEQTEETSDDWLSTLETNFTKLAGDSAENSQMGSPFSNSFDSLESNSLEDEQPNSSISKNSQDPLPAWMHDAGWQESTRNEQQQGDQTPAASETYEEQTISEAGNLPDWLKSLSLENNSSEENMDSPFQPGNGPDFISAPEITVRLDQQPSTEEFKDSLANWKSEDNMDENNVSEPADSESAQNSDWLNQFSSDIQKSEGEKSNDKLPDWLLNYESDKSEGASSQADSPDWLSSLKPDEPEIKHLESSINPLSQSNFEMVAEEPESVIDNLKEEESEVLPDDSQDKSAQENTSERLFTHILEKSEKSDETDDTNESDNYLTPKAQELPESWREDMLEEVESEPVTVDESTVPSWVKNVLNTSREQSDQVEPTALDISVPVEPPTFGYSVPVESQAQSESVDIFEETIKETFTESLQAEDSEKEVSPLEESNTKLETENSDGETPVGLISDQTNDELLQWLRGLNPEDTELDQAENASEDTLESIIEDEGSLDSALDRIGIMPEITENSEPDRSDDLVISFVREGEENISAKIDDGYPEWLEKTEDISTTDLSHAEQTSDSVKITRIEEDLVESDDVIESQSVEEELVRQIDSTSEIVAEEELETENTSKTDLLSFIEDGDFANFADRLSDLEGSILDEAVKNMSSLTDKYQDSFDYWQSMGDLFLKAGNSFKAMEAYKKAETILLS